MSVQTFSSSALKRDGYAFIDCMGKKCGPCKQIAPTIAKLAKKYPDVAFYQMDCAEFEKYADKWEIQSLPTFLFMKDGEEIYRMEGVTDSTEEELKKVLKSL